jgi:hypothetical protein
MGFKAGRRVGWGFSGGFGKECEGKMVGGEKLGKGLLSLVGEFNEILLPSNSRNSSRYSDL